MKRSLMLKGLGMALLAGFACSVIAMRPAPVAATTLKLEVEGKGTVVITLATDKAPETTAHIISLAESKFYDGQKFYSVLKQPKPYLVKFGDPQSKTLAMDDPGLGKNGSGTHVALENTGISNLRGAVGLSTQPHDANSGDSIFYILLADSKFLDGKYTVFGNVTQGMDIVDSLSRGDKVSSVTVVRG